MKSYDDALQFILDNGVQQVNRTGIDTLSVFGHQIRINISERFPILTKRKMFPQAIFKELLWMLSGSTNVNDLEAMGSKIWTPWRDKAFERKHGYDDGELGPIYGWQMRRFGANYANRNSGHRSGFDQISWIVKELVSNPTSRRIIMSYWNPNDVNSDRVKLPPCHLYFQLNIQGNLLSGMLVQRSCDVPIGSPANIQFYAALIYMFAQQCGLVPHELVYSMADAHIYVNQIDSVKEYLSREAVDSPTLELNKAKDILSYKPDDFVIVGYNPLDKISIPVAI
jgi:thymidylate synthase